MPLLMIIIFFSSCFRVNERSSDFYIGRDHFFLEKNLKNISVTSFFLAVRLLFFFQVQLIPFIKRNVNSAIKQRNLKATKNVIDFQF